MQVVYEAANSIDARIVAGMLESRGLECRVDGEFLQGGMGELPVSGLVRVLVADEDVEAARAFIAERDQAAPPPDRRPATESGMPPVIWVFAVVALVLAFWMVGK